MSSSFLSLSLYLISLGQGGYNPSLQAFGADQLGEDEELPCSNTDDTSCNKKALFFQWWYFGVCAGSLMGVTVMSYIQDTFGSVKGFAIPAISMLLSICQRMAFKFLIDSSISFILILRKIYTAKILPHFY
jgi:peptide/histidine transporter 3/4